MVKLDFGGKEPTLPENALVGLKKCFEINFRTKRETIKFEHVDEHEMGAMMSKLTEKEFETKYARRIHTGTTYEIIYEEEEGIAYYYLRGFRTSDGEFRTSDV